MNALFIRKMEDFFAWFRHWYIGFAIALIYGSLAMAFLSRGAKLRRLFMPRLAHPIQWVLELFIISGYIAGYSAPVVVALIGIGYYQGDPLGFKEPLMTKGFGHGVIAASVIAAVFCWWIDQQDESR
ncbi:MAG: hypothetical protein RLZ98_538 [Pseudomonadota bacterium]|jgi:hypothetical protein